MPTANEDFLDALIRHQVYLMRLAGHIRDRVLKLLDATEKDISDAIQRRLANNRGFDNMAAARLKVLQRIILRVRGEAWDKVDDVWIEELTALAKYEPEFVATVLRSVSPVIIDEVLPPIEQLRALVRAKPMEGRTLREWAQRQRQVDVERIMGQVQIGMVQGEPARQIASRVVGTRQMHGTNGVTEITRREAEALTRTAVNFISNEARAAFIQANEELIDEEMFVATLDSRTTPVCRANDGKRFPVGKGPRPPLHFNCRSTRVAVIDGEVFGMRPQKPATEQMLVREFIEKNGLNPRITRRESLPHGTKGDFDKYSQRRVRDLVGQVPAHLSYQDWLSRQSAAFQDDVLGPTRGRLFRGGELRLDRFVNRSGDKLTLAELAAREAEAFARAGLDPADFT